MPKAMAPATLTDARTISAIAQGSSPEEGGSVPSSPLVVNSVGGVVGGLVGGGVTGCPTSTCKKENNDNLTI